MKKIAASFIASLLLVLSHTASAYIIQGGIYNGTDVGGLDLRIDSLTQPANSGNQEELDWANSFINPDVDFANSEAAHRQSDVAYFKTDVAGIFALKLNWLPSYFIIKNGNYHALFQNNSELGWAVFDTALLDDQMNIGKNGRVGDPISHVSEYGETEQPCLSPTQPGCEPTDVPEPSSLGLVALGLIGLGLARRRKI